MKSIYIYGANGHGLVVADIAKECGYDKIIFIDDGKNEYPDFEEVCERHHIPLALGIGDNIIREKLYNKTKFHGFEIMTLVHPSAIVSPSATIGEGTVVMPNVVVNAQTNIGVGVILNTACLIEHECTIGNFAHVSPDVALAGNVKIGELTQVGIGSNVIQGIIIGNRTLIGAGSTVVKNITHNKKAYGNPCKEIEENENE